MGRSIGVRNGKRTKKKAGGSLDSIIIGAGLSLVITAVLTALEAWHANRSMIPVDITPKLSILVWCLSGVAGGYIGAKRTQKGTAVCGLLSGGVYAAVLMLMTGLAYGAQYEGVLKGLAIILASSFLGCILSSFGNRTRRKNRSFR